ncbi:phenylalanine--tRNA ligase subunit alpha [Sporosarcina sp. P21c]|uniref:phenylalanine--tRNA ligase subunit alpha n=1 Tax=unclassified Sporosarcina TaxID=2647733 RepID=UPI000C170352|nr:MULTISPECIES: phenylalanine--tRNA ligase subunit alpha [unclassified Sporosarcina]PIC67741.1 phenylalanine--tRNA ligase subunit alpha [Sporosarcina sp. P16a]PIC90600.1 phenylalanine--tRNA ligase subunit alpha [Sporosarcina sp. P21c]PIC93366.1 phenylalanine--tRNA ligase subunit alpha [Sporosarcina sp. P25]
MKEQLHELKEQVMLKIKESTTVKELNDVRVAYLGKKGPITDLLKGMGKLPAEERPKMGALVNEIRESVTGILEERKETLEQQAIQEQLENESIDVTLPGRPIELGNHHPITRVVEEIEDFFISMGYEIAEGPEVEKDYYNFEALNLPKGHPARDMQDSFYITEDILLRTHTSPVQARTMEAKDGAEIKIICPGKVCRRDSDDATHSHQFTQIEGLVVGENIRMSDLKGTLDLLAKKLFGAEREIRLRPSFFPFTEPSVEMDISCFKCGGTGCNVCKKTGWIEILGAGMVHPNVLEMAGYNPEEVTGFAFGMGAERIAMLKYGVEDIRQFYTNDIRFISQFHRSEA